MSLEDFQLPEFWATYSDIEPLVRALLMEPDRAAKDGQRLSDFVAAVGERGMHGAVAAVALTWGALDDLARVLGVRTATTISLVSRVVPWRDRPGATTNAILASWGVGGHPQAMRWAKGIITDHGDVLARGLAERLVFAVETAALLSRRSPEEQAEVFLERFFTGVR
ncbi:MAG TPA: hypothetical protein VE503_04635 [Ornithinibacter sp.]|nr:hypothetical protein [Ornithinibacter sp.]